MWFDDDLVLVQTHHQPGFYSVFWITSNYWVCKSLRFKRCSCCFYDRHPTKNIIFSFNLKSHSPPPPPSNVHEMFVLNHFSILYDFEVRFDVFLIVVIVAICKFKPQIQTCFLWVSVYLDCVQVCALVTMGWGIHAQGNRIGRNFVGDVRIVQPFMA